MCNQQATEHTREKKPGSRHCETACCKLQKRAVERFPDKSEQWTWAYRIKATERAKRRNIAEACQVVVTVLQTLSPSYPVELWQDIKDSDNMCEALKVTNNFK